MKSKNPYKNTIEVSVRAIIQNHEKILVCHGKGRNYFYFPGGHVEFGERLEKTLTREIREETGLRIAQPRYIGVVDNIFTEDGDKHHEINFVFSVASLNQHVSSKEDHIEFSWVEQSDMTKIRILPTAMKKAAMRWLKDKKMFRASE